VINPVAMRFKLLKSSFYTQRWIFSDVDVVASGGAETSHGGLLAAFPQSVLFALHMVFTSKTLLYVGYQRRRTTPFL